MFYRRIYGIIEVYLGALGATATGLKKLASLRHAPIQVLQLCNEVSDLRVVVAQANRILDSFDGDEDRDLVVRVCRQVKFVTAVVEELRRLLEDHLMQDVPSAGLDRVSDVEYSKRAWLKHQTKSLRLLTEIRGYRVEIDKNLNLLSAGYISQCRIELSQIRLHTSATQQSTQKIELGSQHQMSLMESTLIPALKDVQASLKQLTTSGAIISALDNFWNYLLQDPEDPENKALKEAFSSIIDNYDDLLKRNFTPVHRIVFGLTKADLREHLTLSTSEIDSTCSLGRTPLCWAALRTDPNDVRVLVESGAALHLFDSRGQSPVHFAAETGHIESLKVLLATAAQMEFSDRRLQIAAAARVTEYESQVVKAVSNFCLQLVEAKDYKGRSALYLACRNNKKAHVSILLDYGANIDDIDTALGRSSLHISIYWNCHDVISLLLGQGASTLIVDDDRMTILHYAAKFGDTRTLSILERAEITGLSPECRDRDDKTASEVFDDLRPTYLAEDPDTFMRSRAQFQNILEKVHKARYADSSITLGVDISFDA
ncbi:MAG: hypothetical protein Q9163_004500 [Psora crenata]